ncbi:molybdenum cofactor biosynthesis protein MoaA [Salipiger aestuarii]|uniref:Molybdopterin molybdenumtransferase n=1 Tax=Salipiger aestuarii TaxID=568098 RepID=A0A327YHC4_9RHOB|nr:gephyrin-like molybdotransferase Glp [Salipiger aestuarii]EIE52280.1 MoeA-likedomain-containing protein [Citreicella sp. 357]KAB2542756.1 molybdenum cofactor biosynthesis protein MoaA [Salipiger aestuarii]RAK20304.1 molybdopterin molybdotransferase [Salipiger aestuarii]
MISVSEALDRLFALASPLPVELVPLIEANGRVLARTVSARRDQPPFASSAMDGYALASAAPGLRFRVIGESAAGARFDGRLGPNEAVRIFTGAPVPEGATTVVIQEDVERFGDEILITDRLGSGDNIRPCGTDFRIGDQVLAPRWINPQDIALLASMNIATVPVTRRPRVALISTGDELVMPGEAPGPDQIIASNTHGLHAMLGDLGAEPRLLPIARDSESALRTVFGLIGDADLVITVGGASVGDHDLVARVVADLGMERAFHKVAMRPGKPLMSGKLGAAMMMGLPGNPVSAMVCGHLFMAPVIRSMLGLPAEPALRKRGPLAVDLPANGPREHYMRARILPEGLRPFERQDSSLLSILGEADALVVRPPFDPARAARDVVDFVPL